jgi:GNAT superfamily N-acetyltransferase
LEQVATFLIHFNNKPVGIVDITPCGDGVEVAVLVIDAYQGRGIGKAVVFDFAERLGEEGGIDTPWHTSRRRTIRRWL